MSMPTAGESGEPAPEPPTTADSDAQGRRCKCVVRAISPPGGTIVLVTITGALDSSATAMVRASVDRALTLRPTHLIIDVSRLTSHDAHGASCLADVVHAAALGRAVCRISGLHPLLAASWRACSGRRLPHQYERAADAITAAMVTARRRSGRGPSLRGPGRRRPAAPGRRESAVGSPTES